MAQPTPHTSPPLQIQTRPRRLSKFTEGSASTRPDLISRTPTSNEFLLTILSEMDAHEQKRRGQHAHRNSHSSVESFTSSSASSPQNSPNFSSSHEREMERERERERALPAPKEGRRSINFARKSLGERPRDFSGDEADRKKGFKGRLRAFTGARREDVKPYAGT